MPASCEARKVGPLQRSGTSPINSISFGLLRIQRHSGARVRVLNANLYRLTQVLVRGNADLVAKAIAESGGQRRKR